ncbi:MAG: DUF4391 domain-containing protein [Selenomonadaceae bacterium]|nr:DUF4391 domain-containing protein [Selenomonadaceae bacterium]
MLDIYTRMKLPHAARVDQVMAKKLFYEQPHFSSHEQKLFTRDIEKITLRAQLLPENTHLLSFVDEVREYRGMLYLEIALRQQAHRQRIAELCWQFLPWPQVLIFRYDTMYALNMALVRLNQADKSRNTVEERLDTDWGEADDALWQAVSLQDVPAQDFYQLYRGLFDRLSQFMAVCDTINMDRKIV